MKVIRHTDYQTFLQRAEVDKPAPVPGEVALKVVASGVERDSGMAENVGVPALGQLPFCLFLAGADAKIRYDACWP